MSKALQNQLEDFGYNLVALPKKDIPPLLLLYKSGEELSSTEDLVYNLFTIADSPPPTVKKDQEVIGIVGSANVKFDSETGINVLEWLLAKLNMGKMNAKLNLNAENKILISYENIKEDKVSLLELDNFISGAEPDNTKFKTFREKLENSELYVVNAILKSDAFSIVVEAANGQSIDMEAEVKGILNADVNVTRNKNNALTLKHANAQPLVFAFKAQRILYDQKNWWEFFNKKEARFRIKDQKGVVLKGESEFPTNPLSQGTRLNNI